MPTVTVEFRGVMLFARHAAANVLDRVLIPLALPGVVPRDGARPQPGAPHPSHADGTPARPHHVGLAVWRGTQKEPRIRIEPLRGYVVLEDAGTGPRVADIANTGNLVGVSAVTNAGRPADLRVLRSVSPDLLRYAAASIDIRGGAMRPSRTFGDSDSRFHWRLHEQVKKHGIPKKRLTLRYQWATDAEGPVVLRVTPPGGDWAASLWITLGADDRAYVYNVDDPTPTEDQLNAPQGAKEPEEDDLVDHDFKWLYQLLPPADGSSLVDWLHDSGASTLPAPEFVKDAVTPRADEAPGAAATGDDPSIRHPTVSTCFPATWP